MRTEITSRAVVLVWGFLFCFAWCRAAADVFTDKAQIESLIESGKLADANQRIEKLKADYAQDSQLPCALYWIGRRYEWSKNDDQARNIYQQVIQNYPSNEYAAKCRLSLATQDVLSLIISAKYDPAREAVDKLLADFANEPDLAETLYWVARRYGWSDKYEEEKNLYQKIIQNHPDNPFANKARLGFARADVLSLILSKNFDQGQTALTQLQTDFAAHPDLPDALYWVAERYRWAHKWEDAKDLYQKVVQDYPNSPAAGRARIGLSRVEVLALIGSDDYAAAKKALDKLVTDFAANPDLPETLYWIAEDFRWANQYETAKSTYLHIIENYPACSYASGARLGFSVANICSLISLGQIEEAQAATEKMKTEFAGCPDLPDVLYSIALRLEWSNNYEQAKAAYEQVPQQSSEGTSKGDTQLHIARMNVCSLIASEQFQAAQSALNDLIADFNDHPDIVETVLTVGEEYAEKAYQYEDRGDTEKTREYAQRAIEVWEKIITDFPPCDLTAQAYYAAGASYKTLGEFDKAIQYCTKILDELPDFRSAWQAQFLIALCYEQLEASGQISQADAAAQINQVCQKLAGYPAPQARIAARSLLKKWALTEN